MIIKIINNNETNSTSLLCAYILVLVKAKSKGTTLLFVKIGLVYCVLKMFENQNNLQYTMTLDLLFATNVFRRLFET